MNDRLSLAISLMFSLDLACLKEFVACGWNVPSESVGESL